MSNNIDDAALWWENRNAEIQSFTAPDPEDLPSFVNIEEKEENETEVQTNITNQEVRTQLNMIKLNEPVAGIVTGLMNSLVPVLLVLIIKDIDDDKLKLTDSEKDTLTQAWAQYLKDSNIQMSPGMVLLGTIAIIYGGKINLVLNDRKQKREKEEKENAYMQKIEMLTRRLEELQRNGKDDKKN